MMMRSLVLVCLWLAVSLPAWAQAAGNTALDANAAYMAKDWPKAEQLYQSLAQSQADNSRNWYRLGICLHQTGKNDKAIEAFQRAKTLGAAAQNVEFGLAEVFASTGDKDSALQHLAEAVKQGYALPDQMTTDSDLQSVRTDPRFVPLLEQARHNEKPCASTPENRQFDFWEGDWDVVTTPDGVTAGTSHIERVIGDCVIWENWSSLGSSYTGKSYNTYNSDLKRWEQFWVDNVGGMVHFYGHLTDGTMNFFTDEIPQPDGTKVQRHLQFFNQGPDKVRPDKVRQFSQMSSDGGKTWTTEYDFTYNRKK